MMLDYLNQNQVRRRTKAQSDQGVTRDQLEAFPRRSHSRRSCSTLVGTRCQLETMPQTPPRQTRIAPSGSVSVVGVGSGKARLLAQHSRAKQS